MLHLRIVVDRCECRQRGTERIAKPSGKRQQKLGPTLAHLVAAVLFASALVGCQGSGVRQVDLTPDWSGSLQQLNAPRLQRLPHPLVVITFPTELVANTPAEARQYYRSQYPGGDSYQSDAGIDAAITESYAKTLYFACEIYEVLSQRLPPGCVVLCPAEKHVEGVQDKLVYPAFPEGALPVHLVRLDIAPIYVSAIRQTSGGITFRDTIGNRVTPSAALIVLTLDTDRPLSLKGLDHVASHGGESEVTKFGGLQEVCIHLNTRHTKEVQGVMMHDLPEFTVGENQFYAGLQQTRPQPGWERAGFRPLWRYYADATIGVLNDEGAERARFPWMGVYLGKELNIDQKFEEAWYAELTEGKPLKQAFPTDGDQRRQLFEQFLEIERDFLTAQDRQFVDNIYHGAFGDAMRQQLAAEAKFLSEVRASDARQEQAALLSLVNTSVAGAYAGQVARAGNHAAAMNMVFTNMQSQMSQMNQTADRETELVSQLRQSLHAQLTRMSTVQREYSLKTTQGESKLRAASLQELRRGFREAYLQAFPVR